MRIHTKKAIIVYVLFGFDLKDCKNMLYLIM